MLQDIKPSIGPAKAKAKEENNWRPGWWDFYPLLEPTLPYVSAPVQLVSFR
jgi:hypothetical protein